jgi:hypothetical protein
MGKNQGRFEITPAAWLGWGCGGWVPFAALRRLRAGQPPQPHASSQHGSRVKTHECRLGRTASPAPNVSKLNTPVLRVRGRRLPSPYILLEAKSQFWMGAKFGFLQVMVALLLLDRRNVG